MILHRSTQATVSAVIVVLLAACGHEAVRSNDATGELGTGRADSPADVYVAMAAEYYKRGQLEVALQRAKHAIEVDSNNGRAHYMLALLYQKLGENGLAEQQFSEAARLEPKNPDIRNAWGTFYCSQNKQSEAESQFKTALENPLYSTPEVALTNAAICASRGGDRAKEEEYLRRALAANPAFPPALSEMADLEYQRGKYKAAQGLLDRYIQVAPPSPQMLLLGVRVERKLGATRKAATYAQLLRKNFPHAPEVLALNET
jgi:type IV pilus assembly protein PilF